jgi:hypothetical protein
MGDKNQIDCRRTLPGASPFQYFNFQVRTIVLDVLGNVVNAPLPLLRRLAVMDFAGMPVGIISMTLSTSLINQQPLDTVGVFAGIDNGLLISAGGSCALFLDHIVRQNSTVAVRAASSRTNSVTVPEGSVYPLPSGKNLALYCCSGNFAGNEISAVLNVFWTPLPSGAG